jgi:beta-lactamase class A
VRRSSSNSPLRWIALILIFSAVIITILKLVSYSRIRTNFPSGMVIANIPVGGLDRQRASERLLQAYGIPIEVHYVGAVVQIKPSSIGFELDLTNMLATADLQRVNQPFWPGFWDSLWNRPQASSTIPLKFSFSETRLRQVLIEEIAPRYDQSPSAASPIPGTANFSPGQPGISLDIDKAVSLITDALHSPTNRVVTLSYNQTEVPRPVLQNLEILLKQIIDLSQFKGIVELYLANLQNQQTIHFAYQSDNAEPIPVNIAFSGWSTIKIPVMVSAFIHMKDPPPNNAIALMELSIERSDNDSTDKLAAVVIDANLAPIIVTEDMRSLGLVNTFWGGFFYQGAPLLQRYSTPANQRTDINTDPDLYDQTTPADLGMLLEDIYQCAKNGGGTFGAVFPNTLTQKKCQDMITYLGKNDIPVLIQAGVPAGTRVAHKHGWANEIDGLIHTMGDAGIVYTPGGNYVLVIFIHNDNQVVFDPANQMVAELSTAIYNYFNISNQ